MDTATTKLRRCRPMETGKPAVYSNSWAGTGLPKTTAKKNVGKTSQKLITVMRNAEPPNYYRPDPTVPHLKYGLFPKRISRGQSRVLGTNPETRMSQQSSPLITDVMKERKNVPKKKPPSKYDPVRVRPTRTENSGAISGGDESEKPVMVFRPIDHRDYRRLTVSESTHLDIKPRQPVHSTASEMPYRRY